MKYIRHNHNGLRYEWDSRDPWARCLNQNAQMLPAESYQFSQMEREKVARVETSLAVFEIEGMK